MISFEKLYQKLSRHPQITIKKNYLVICPIGQKYHITVFKDQWNDYKKVTKMDYHLFHISTNATESKCSSYFWVDTDTYQILNIPPKYFKYNKNYFSFYTSTRQPCDLREIRPVKYYFQKLLYKLRGNQKDSY